MAALKVRSWSSLQFLPQKAMPYANDGSSRPSTSVRMKGEVDGRGAADDARDAVRGAASCCQSAVDLRLPAQLMVEEDAEVDVGG